MRETWTLCLDTPVQTFWNINSYHCISTTSIAKSQVFWVVMHQARHLYLDIWTQTIFFSKSLWNLSIYMYAYLEIQKYYTDLRFLLSFSTTSNQPHLSAWIGVPAQWDTALSVMETACMWYTQRPGWVTITWTCRKMYLNSKWILLVLVAQSALLKWRGLILTTVQCSYHLLCLHTRANERSKHKYFYLLKQSVLFVCLPQMDPVILKQDQVTWLLLKILPTTGKYQLLNWMILLKPCSTTFGKVWSWCAQFNILNSLTSLTSKSLWEQMSINSASCRQKLHAGQNKMQLFGVSCSSPLAEGVVLKTSIHKNCLGLRRPSLSKLV